MIITDEEQMDLDIWPESPNLDINTEDMIITIWSKKALRWRQFIFQEYHPLSLTLRKICYE